SPLSLHDALPICRLVALLGMGGIGKSMLASLLGSRLASQFEAVLWRSLRDAPPVRGAGRRLHHLLLRDATRRLPLLAGAAHHAVAGPLAGEPPPAGARQPGVTPAKRGPRRRLPARLRGLRTADSAPGRVGPPELRAADQPREA